MQIDHVAMYVCDLEKAKAFYQTYFGGKANTQYHNPKTGLRTYFLSFENGCRLEIMSRPDIAIVKNSKEQGGYAHLAFSAGDKESVDALTGRLRNDGYTVFGEPRTTGDGYYESCVSDPDGNRIEIVV
ncbi:MAG: VOC family protein [Clostridia bacterium]|nr:VOC family protein [Clostridia bacterium]